MADLETELTDTLQERKDKVHKAARGSGINKAVHLFAIEYADKLNRCKKEKGFRVLIRIARGYSDELNRGIKLAEHVKLSPNKTVDALKNMSFVELVSAYQETCKNEEYLDKVGGKVIARNLFGIRYAREIKNCADNERCSDLDLILSIAKKTQEPTINPQIFAGMNISQDVEFINKEDFEEKVSEEDYKNEGESDEHKAFKLSLKEKVPEKDYKGGGESDEHKALKRWVKEHPEAVALSGDLESADEEYDFASAHAVDVMFKSDSEWLAVEVKSHISDKNDIRRGLHQCVAYKALTDAEIKLEDLSVPSRSILIVQKELSDDLIREAEILGVEVCVIKFD